MVILAIIERVLAFVIVVLFITQLILPPFIGKRFFWWFRKSEKKISKKENELSELKDAEKVVELDEEIQKKKEELNKKMTDKKE